MAYTAADYLDLLQGLLPTGPVWPRDPSAAQTQVLGALMPTYARLAGRDENLLVDAFPATSVELLTEWESTLGLPDPCAGVDPPIALRQALVAARLTESGGNSRTFLTALAAQLGYTISITDYAPFRFGRNTFGDPMRGVSWAFAWTVTLEGTIAGAAATAAGVAVVSCQFGERAAAHTTLLVDLNALPPGGGAPLDSFALGFNGLVP